MACDIVAERNELSGRIQAGLEIVVARRTIVVVMQIVFARPQQLHRYARQTSLGSLVGNQSGDFRDLDVIFVVQPAAEASSGANQMECDILVLNTGRYCSIEFFRSLARRPDFELPIFVVRC